MFMGLLLTFLLDSHQNKFLLKNEKWKMKNELSLNMTRRSHDHNTNQWEITPLTTTITIMPSFSLFPSSNPLFSTIVTLYTLILLYFPHFFLKLIFSPLLISTSILLLTLLRFGASQQPKTPTHAGTGPSSGLSPGPEAEPSRLDRGDFSSHPSQKPDVDASPPCNSAEAQPDPEPEPERCHEGFTKTETHQEEEEEEAAEHSGKVELRPDPEHERGLLESEARVRGPDPGPRVYCGKGFHLGWEFGAPLEVIYEAYEEGEEVEESQNGAFREEKYNKSTSEANNGEMKMADRYPSLSKYYPDSDSDPDSDSESCSSIWSGDHEEEEEDQDQEEREELIEIALDYQDPKKEERNFVEEIHVEDDEEEDNLIEIDISPTVTTITTRHGFSR